MRISDWSSDVCSSDLFDLRTGESTRKIAHCSVSRATKTFFRLDSLVLDGSEVEGAFRSFIIDADQRRCGARLFKALSDHQRDSLIIMFYRRPRQHMRSMVACLAKLARIVGGNDGKDRSEEHTTELQSLMRI